MATPLPLYAHRRADIDGLRAVAVLPVVGYHAFSPVVPWGFVGVDIFFVISGFLITTILLEGLESGRFSFANFYMRRVRRIFPALAVVLLATFAAGLVMLLPAEMSRLGSQVAAAGGFAANLLFASELGYFDWQAPTKPLLHLWSLGVEEQFYIAWPLVLWLLRKRPRALVFACLALPLASFTWNCVVVASDPIAAFYSPFTRMWEILAGASLAWIAVHRSAWLERGAQLRSVAGLAALIVAAVFIDDRRAFPGFWALLPVAAAWLLMSAGPGAWLNRRVLANPLLVGIGLISYPLYLWHWPILVFIRLTQGPFMSNSTAMAAIAAAFLLAWATYRLVEIPLRFGPRGPAKAWGLAALMVCLIAAGLVAKQEGGFPARMPPLVRALVDAPYDFHQPWRASVCFLDPEQDRTAFDQCPDRFEAPTLLLWGDSHAAHLYPGVAERFGATWHVVQRTASACPPLLDTDVFLRVHCRGINDRVIAEVERFHPAVVVLSARWGPPGYYKLDGLASAIERMKAAGTRRIVVVGPSLTFRQFVQRELYLAYLRDPGHRIPSRLADAIDTTPSANGDLAQVARQHGVEFVDSEKALCNAAGCLARVGEDAEGVMFWDQAHYTPAGSRFMALRLPIPVDPAALR